MAGKSISIFKRYQGHVKAMAERKKFRNSFTLTITELISVPILGRWTFFLDIKCVPKR